MANSLQDQLLKAGLVSKQQAKQNRSSKKKTKKRQGGVDQEAQARKRALAEQQRKKAEQDRELNRKHAEEARARAQAEELRQLIHAHRLTREGADIAFNFTDGGKLKRLYVNAEQQKGLIAGRLAVVRQDTFFELVPKDIAERVAERNAALVLVLNKPDETKADEEDEYADYQVPDDLMW